MAPKTIWRIGIWAILLVNMFGLRFLIARENMWDGRENHDTRVMYRAITAANNPARWLVGDWPLRNGFYRPLPALAFEADVRLWGDEYPNYKFLNLAVAFACALLLAWFMFELTRSPILALGSSLLFSLWQSGLIEWIPVGPLCQWAAAVPLLFAVSGILNSKHPTLKTSIWKPIVLAALLWYLPYELDPGFLHFDLTNMTFSYRSMGWPPGRTATIFTMFALTCLASYVRYEMRDKKGWLALSGAALIATFCSYEQAVIMPACLAACAVYLHFCGHKPRWACHVIPWLLLGLYIWWHVAAFSVDTEYHRSHASRGIWPVLKLGEWLFPAIPDIGNLYVSLDPEIGVMVLVLPVLWIALAAILSNVASYYLAMREWKLASFGILASAGAVAPMVFQKALLHYYYFPAALRSVFGCLLVIIAWQLAREIVRQRLPRAATADDLEGCRALPVSQG